jgi:F-type H+-transporting ATPase subunit delta
MEEVRQFTALDPRLQYLGTVYAKALLGATEKAGDTDKVLGEFSAFLTDVLDKLPQLEATLASPRIAFEVKEQMLDRALAGKMNPRLLNFVKVVTRRGRFDAIRAVHQAASRLYNQLRGRVEVRLTTAEPIDRATRDLIVKRLTASLGREIDLKPRVDAQILGGVVIRIGDTVYDGSIANQLNQLRGDLVARATQSLRRQADRIAAAS